MQAVLDALPDPAFILSKSGKYVALFGGKDSRYYHDGSALVGRLLSEVLNASKTQYFISKIEEALQASGFIDWLEENEVIHISPMPSKKLPEINKKFGLNDAGVEHLWAFEAMEMDKLYNLLDKNKIKPQKKAIIAILDTGVDAKHEDIKANFKSLRLELFNKSLSFPSRSSRFDKPVKLS